ncbi:MAG: hypothetical protein ACE5JO_05795, partial [Candidatus Binatia bacterium]
SWEAVTGWWTGWKEAEQAYLEARRLRPDRWTFIFSWETIAEFQQLLKMDFGALEDLIKTFLYPLPLGYILGWRWQAMGVSEIRAYRRGVLVGLALGTESVKQRAEGQEP